MPFEEAIRSTRFDSPTHKAVLNTVFTANWVRDLDRQQFEGAPIGLQHYNVLRILRGRHPATACPGDIKAVMLDRPADPADIDRILLDHRHPVPQLCQLIGRGQSGRPGADDGNIDTGRAVYRRTG